MIEPFIVMRVVNSSDKQTGRELMWLPGTNLNRKPEMGDIGKHFSPLPSIK
jgi:hypothetical protein